MRLASIGCMNPSDPTDLIDGELVIVHSSGTKVARIPERRYPSLLSTLDEWHHSEPFLRELSELFENDKLQEVIPASACRFMAPLPRTWAFLDGSAFVNHIVLVRKARGAEPPEDMLTVPLMYQGISDALLGPYDEVPLINPEHGLDFEGEIAAVLKDVPVGSSADEAKDRIALFMLLNDWSLRNLIPREMQTGFGFLQSKPASSFAPFAITPDELGDNYKEGRIHLPLTCELNGTVVGSANAGEMHFSFFDLIQHAAATRLLRAGTILGSGTVSNNNEKAGISCLAEKRMREKIQTGEIKTPFLKVSDVVRMEMRDASRSLFGHLEQSIVSLR